MIHPKSQQISQDKNKAIIMTMMRVIIIVAYVMLAGGENGTWNVGKAAEAANLHSPACSSIDSLPWPMSLAPRITSTFGEYRDSHFHAGIDLSTYGRSGYALRALDSGCLLRVRVDPSGYGNMVYIKLDNGLILVYAHMKRFASSIRSCVREMQEQVGKCNVDFYIEPDRVRFKQGDIVGISGGTGAGPPHVHLELRNEYNEPVNPLLCGYALPDTTPPRFYRFVVTPLGSEARVNGRRRSRTIRLRFDRDEKHYDALSVPHVWGEIGLSVRAFDRVNLGGDKVGIYRYTVSVDGEEIFRRTYSRMTPREWNFIDLVYDRDLMRRGFGRCERLYIMKGDNLTFHTDSPGDGIIRAGLGQLEYGDHTIDVLIEDAAGNNRSAYIPIVVNRSPEITDLVRKGTDSLQVNIKDEQPERCTVTFKVKRGGRWHTIKDTRRHGDVFEIVALDPGELLECVARDTYGATSAPFYFGQPDTVPVQFTADIDHRIESRLVTVSLKTSHDLVRPPRVFVAPGRFGYTPARMWATDSRSYEMELSLLPEAIPGYRVLFLMEEVNGAVMKSERLISFEALLVDRASVVQSDDGVVVMSAQINSVFEDAYLQVERRGVPQPGNGLERISDGYTFTPQQTILKNPVTVSMAVPTNYAQDGGEGIGVFRWFGGSDYRAIGASWDSVTCSVSGFTDALGTFAVLRDVHPPRINLTPRHGSVSYTARPSITAEIHDSGSGVDSHTIQMYVDGRPVPACPLGGGRWRYRPDDSLSSGLHSIRMVVRDKVGNPSSAHMTFRVK